MDEKAPLTVGRAEIGVAALDGKVYALGGTAQAGDGKSVWNSTLNSIYDPKTDMWKDEAPLPTGLSHIGVATLDGKLYAIGGFTDVVHMRPQALAFVYDPKVDRWSALPNISTSRIDCSGCRGWQAAHLRWKNLEQDHQTSSSDRRA